MFHYTEAFWTASAAYAAWTVGCVGLLLNAAGIYLLVSQLKANRSALKAAAESADAATEAARLARLDTRPWLKPSVPAIVPCSLRPIGEAYLLHVEFPLQVENIGRTPALMVGVTARVLREAPVEEVDFVLGQMSEGGIKTNKTVFPGEHYSASMTVNAQIESADITSSVRVVCAVMISYRDHHEGTVMTTPVVLILSNVGASDPPVYRTLRPAYGIEAIELVPYVLHARSPT